MAPDRITQGSPLRSTIVETCRSADRQVSTIVDLSGEPCVIRSGAIPIEELDAYLR